MDATVIWDDGPGGNVEHVGEHGLTPEEVDEVLLDDTMPTAYSETVSYTHLTLPTILLV